MTLEELREQAAKIAGIYMGDALKPAAGWTDDQVRWWEFGVTDSAAAIVSAIRAMPLPAPVALPQAGEGAEQCVRCGHQNTVWRAPSPLWNAVIRGGCINGEPIFDDMVCAACFMVLAEEKGIAANFRVIADNIYANLQTVTPSGRVWDEEEWLWRPSPNGRGDGLKIQNSLGSNPRDATNTPTETPTAAASLNYYTDCPRCGGYGGTGHGDATKCTQCNGNGIVRAAAPDDGLMGRYRDKIAFQAQEITRKDRVLHEKNIALDGMAWVWCDGGCPSGTGRFTDLEVTEEMVAMVERNTKRLRSWFRNHQSRAALSTPTGDEAQQGEG